jgi:hypothetical protein
MQKALYILLHVAAIALLLFNGIGALYGGWQLATDPTGGSMQMPLSYLQHSPFKTYLIPGIVLFIANGVGSLVVLGLMVARSPYYPAGVIAEGFILGGWISIQMLMLQTANPLQLTFTTVAVLLIASGLGLLKLKKAVLAGNG